MTKIKNWHIFIIVCCAVITFSCKKNIVPEPSVPEAEGLAIPAASPVSGRITGLVVDENNVPVENAEVIFSGATYATDVRGFFHVNTATLDKYITTVTVNKPGYFKALRAFAATDSRNFLAIKLIPKTLAGTFDAAAGGSAGLSNGALISFQNSSIVMKTTGAVYNGTVNVYAAYIDPTSDDFSARVPGSMMGQDAENMFVLQSTGMIAVDLESPAGQALQLVSSKPASIKLPIPSSLLSKAPASIDTWSLDDRGVWIKEGVATKNGAFYDMQVSHFSYWNCDIPMSTNYLTIHLVDQNGNPVPNVSLQLTIPDNNNWWATISAYADSTGTTAGLIPLNQAFLLTAYANVFSCVTPIVSLPIGPFTGDTTITVVLNVQSQNIVTISGTAIDCAGQPVANGVATMYVGAYNYYTAPIVDGSYSLTIATCAAMSTVNVIVLGSSAVSASSGTIPISGNNVSVPPITVCGTGPAGTFTIQSCEVSGYYAVDYPVTPWDLLQVTVSVQTPGSYQFTATSTAGISFSGSGVFTQTGTQTINLPASGIPTAAGSFPVILTGGGQSCTSLLTVIAGQGSTAVFTMGSGICQGVIVNGSYVSQLYLDQSNTVSVPVNVTAPGSYNIFTTTANGIFFRDSGMFTSTGMQVIQMQGWGTPNVPGTNQYQLVSNGVTGCSFDVTTLPVSTAQFSCLSYTVGGVYTSGVALTAQNTITVMVEVTTPGVFNVVTNPTNGFSFVAAGVFNSTGVQQMVFTGSGTPLNPAANTFVLNGSPAGCVFIVNSN